jgi:hypothetical protein
LTAVANLHLLAVEAAEEVPAFGWLTQLTLKLPDELTDAGEILVSISVRGSASNKALITITSSGARSPE